MREYGKIKSSTWADEKFQALSGDARLLFIYLQTSDHTNLVGCFRLHLGYIMADLNWSEAKAKLSLTECLQQGLIKRCDKTGWTFIINFLRHNQFESPNVAKTAIKFADAIPSSLPFYSCFINALQQFGKWVPEDYSKAKLSLTEDIREVLANPEPEPEPNQSPARTQPEPEPTALTRRASDVAEITQAISDWNELAAECGLAACQKITDNRRTRIRARLKDVGGLAGWQAALSKIRESPFLRGVSDRGWKADFDWLLSESNFVKVMEGKYDGKPAKPETTWASTGDALAAKYRAAAELEAAGQIPIVAGIEPSLRLATPIRQDAGRA